MVATTGIVLGVAGLTAAIGAPLGIENRKKPKLEIKPLPWAAAGPTYPMTFASVQVVNRPIRGPLGRLLNRDVAEACEVFIDFFTWGDKASRIRVFETIPGRWDAHPEPWRPVFEVETTWDKLPIETTKIPGQFDLNHPHFNVKQTGAQYDPSMVSAQQDISVGSDRGRVSVAILRDGEAFAFADESYMHIADHLAKPDWKLTIGSTYRVEVRVKGANVDHMGVFKLEYYSGDFTNFRLQPVKE